MSTAESRKKNVYLAKLAERAERYEDMAESMDKVVITVGAERLTAEERSLLSLAYKKVIGARRSAWRVISSIEKEEGSGNEDHAAIIKNYRSKIETEFSNICNRILNLLHSHLIPAAAAADLKVFYLKMKGDYQRYLAEVMTGTKREEAAENTLLTYKSAQDIALSELAPYDPARLGLALNFSVFYREILKSTDNAINLATQAYEEAATDLDTLDKKIYKDSILMMKVLEDNLTLWSSDPPEEGTDETDGAPQPETTKGQL